MSGQYKTVHYCSPNGFCFFKSAICKYSINKEVIVKAPGYVIFWSFILSRKFVTSKVKAEIESYLHLPQIRRHISRQTDRQPSDRRQVNVIYTDSQEADTAPGETAAICLSFVLSYKTQSALHVICQRAVHGDRYRV